MLAAAVSTAVGWTKNDRLNVAACSRTSTLRAGEARKPGPRPKRKRQCFSLEEVNIVSAATLVIQSRMLLQFFNGCAEGTEDCEFFLLFNKLPVQHMRVSDSMAIKLISMIFGNLPYEDMLYPQSPYHYRKKWDLLLEDLFPERSPPNSGWTMRRSCGNALQKWPADC